MRAASIVVVTFVLIGLLTTLWRAAGTVSFIVTNTAGLVHPHVVVLLTFLLNCLMSLLTGSSFASAATMGVITMTLGASMQVPPVFLGGAILSGIYFGDRCSPMSTSALLISELTQTDIYCNIKNMFNQRCCLFQSPACFTPCWDFPVPATPAQPTCTHSFRKTSICTGLPLFQRC